MQKKTVDIKAAQLLNEELVQDQFTLTPAEDAVLNGLYQEHGSVFTPGQLFTGKIVQRSNNGIVVDVAFKSYGTVPLSEFNAQELALLVEGAPIEVLIDRLEDEHGSIVLSYQKAKSMKAWDRVIELAKEDKPVTGVVTGKVKGGLNVDIGIPAFLPGSQIDVQRINDFDQFLGQEIVCKILKINKKRGNVIISRRRYIESERQANKSKVMGTIVLGQIIHGIAKNITNYGVFVDIGGVDGLLHITDMSWGRVSHPSELIKIGDPVTVKVIALDREHEKISLGVKQLSTNPWDDVEHRYPTGTSAKGKVSSITDYGLFVELAPGIEGLVHISEVSWLERITNLHRVYSVGKEVEVMILTVDKHSRRMSLSIKQLTPDPWMDVVNRYKMGDRITGKVTNITDFGIFVEIVEGIDGLVHISDMSWTDHSVNPNDLFKRGDTVSAVMLGVDTEAKKISLGIKQLQTDPWEHIDETHPIGSVVNGTVVKLASFGAFVRLDNGIEGLIHSSETAENAGIKVGDTLQCRVIKLNKEERKLGLSIKTGDTYYQGQHAEGDRRKDAAARKKAAEAKPAVTSMKSILQQALQDHADRTKSDKGEE